MDEKYINCILLIKHNSAYYFDKDGKFSSINVSELNKQSYKNYNCFRIVDNDFYYTYGIEIDGISENQYRDFVLSQLELGDSFEIFIELFRNPKTKKSFLTNYVLKKKNNTSYFFNEHGIFSSLPFEETKPPSFKNVTKEGNFIGYIPNIWDSTSTSYRIKLIIGSLNEGDSFDKLNELISDPKITGFKPKPNGIDRFITKICRPDIYRSTDNKNDKTFDFIGVDVFFLSTIKEETAKRYIQQHLLEIFDKVKQKLLSTKGYKKYGVPINFLKCSYKIDYSTSSIHFLFSFKELPEYYENNEEQNR